MKTGKNTTRAKKAEKPPEKKKSGRSTRTSRRYLKEAMTYGTNTSKWKYAKAYAEDRGWEFQVWTEDTLRDLGIKILK